MGTRQTSETLTRKEVTHEEMVAEQARQGASQSASRINQSKRGCFPTAYPCFMARLPGGRAFVRGGHEL